MKKFSMAPLVLVFSLLLAACATTPPNPLVGAWAMTIQSPIGEMAVDINVNPDLTGQMTSADLGAASLDNILVADQAVSFETTVDAQGQMLTLRFRGTLEGDQLTGNFDTDFGAIPASATRQ